MVQFDFLMTLRIRKKMNWKPYNFKRTQNTTMAVMIPSRLLFSATQLPISSQRRQLFAMQPGETACNE